MNKEYQKELCRKRNKFVQMYEQGILGKRLGKHTHGQTAYRSTSKTQAVLLLLVIADSDKKEIDVGDVNHEHPKSIC
jgi:hypothetical protein